jgi:hypothetical protein
MRDLPGLATRPARAAVARDGGGGWSEIQARSDLEEDTMRYVFALVAAAGLALGSARDARAQFALSVGNPYTGGGVYVGANYGAPYWFGAGNPYGVYSSGYYGMSPVGAATTVYSTSALAPVTGVYRSGYSGVMPSVGVTSYGAPLGYGYYSSVFPGYARYRYRPFLGGYRMFGARRYYAGYPGLYW